MVECAECSKTPKLPEWLEGWRHSLDGETSVCPECWGEDEDDDLEAAPTRCWE